MLSFIYKQSFSRKNLRTELLGQYNREAEKNIECSKKGAENEYLGDHILHPYLSFLNVPNEREFK